MTECRGGRPFGKVDVDDDDNSGDHVPQQTTYNYM